MSKARWAVGIAIALGATLVGVASGQVEGSEGASDDPSRLPWLPVERATLDNGLRVVLSRDPSIPTVAIAVYYDVGSRNEIRGRSGFAHLFEHMMFQGSANVGKGQHISLIMNRGGSMNGTTSADRTNYYETLPANELALGLWLEADRMRSLAVNEDNFENQRAVVIQEYQQSYGNRPYARSFLRIDELSYGDYWPYAHSTIGDVRDLEDAPLEAVQEFFHHYYPPNNAVLSISGDFERDAAMALVDQYFGDVGRRPVPPYEPPDLPPQTSERTDVIQDPLAQLPAFHMRWHIPPMREPDHYALEMLGLILGDGNSSRLYQRLVRGDELCTDVSVRTDDRRGPDVFSIFAVMSEGHEPAEAQAIVDDQIARIVRRGVDAREIEKARNRIRAYFFFGLQSNVMRAQRLAEYELYYGNANEIREELGRYLSITAEDIQRVTGQYLTETNRTVLDVVPAGAAEGGEG